MFHGIPLLLREIYNLETAYNQLFINQLKFDFSNFFTLNLYIPAML